jgi:hypothetical protein
MSLESHLSELRRKHEALGQTIEREQRRPGADDLRINELKREKLQIKERIERLSANGHAEA